MIIEKFKILLSNIGNTVKNFNTKRDNQIVLFGAWFGNRFADNSRFLFQYLSENKEKLQLTHVVWVTRNPNINEELNKMGYECYMMDSAKSIEYHKKAGIHIICHCAEKQISFNNTEKQKGDILLEYSNGAFKVNLWHGLGGIKGVEFASKQYELQKKRNPFKYAMKETLHRIKFFRKYAVRYGGWGDCKYLSTTPFQTEILQRYFFRDKKHFIEAAYPRNEKCIKLLDNEKRIIDLLKTKKNNILYLPTFRDTNKQYQEPLDNSDFDKFIQENDIYWINKKHNFTGDLFFGQNNHVLYLDSTFDIYTILPYIDLIITDYSSVVWDAVYFDIPVFFYIPDIKEYESNDRGFILSKDEFLIGEEAVDLKELEQLLIKYNGNYKRAIHHNYQKIKEKMWGKNSGYQYIWDAIISSQKK